MLAVDCPFLVAFFVALFYSSGRKFPVYLCVCVCVSVCPCACACVS